MVGLRVTLLGGFEARLASGAPLSLPTSAEPRHCVLLEE